ncbi:hypothetical protein M409DRAFT_71698 [Zasmidium cellare ATCC 36951]|uniref:RBR-type E3 ubiquitin transferase n=1 Tax=Zasmidium cellare ATCC 36951 TaxID=1080233 RepID=A0A6A6BU33_ZASCE|nr:uncharacterized protein M409DRAFT_71698 [Zasmidium cellare ATCC 36951]KAF2158314.1 hypothetical protein M409DRAFT_71698 [Zasmidium cellare ATCC 36951]
MAVTAGILPTRCSFDDDIAMITLQMEEFDIFAKQDKGKYRAEEPPDFKVALEASVEELQIHKYYLYDCKFAQSIGAAVHEDETIIAALASEDHQAYEDREMALRLNEDPDLEHPGQATESDLSLLDKWLPVVAETIMANALITTSDDELDQAGPSMTFAERQADLLVKLSQGFTCSVCRETRRCDAMAKVQCEHRYCIDCAKELFIRATNDEELFPPRCCKKPIDATLVRRHMTDDELEAYDIASIEFATIDRTYCSNRQCGKFLPAGLMHVGTKAATCKNCDTCTCCICNNEYHRGSDCPNDPALRATRKLALANGWQTCPGCNVLVQLRTGCNYITCRCKTEFCYVCGIRWKNCHCDVADEGRMIERAEEVVDRDAEAGPPRAERNRRVRLIHSELQENHECEHRGRFQRLLSGGRRGFQCEMCDARHWKYILQCRHCYINVCEDCRRNRI